MIGEDSIEGVWERTEVTVSGVKQANGQCRLVCKRGAITFTADGFEMPYKIDSSRMPSHLDFKPPTCQTVKCIYQIDGDKLKLAYIASKDNWNRPQRFDEGGVRLEIYKRVNK